METKQKRYKVDGMHCKACEVIIEKKLLRCKGINSAAANSGKGEVLVSFGANAQASNPLALNSLFEQEGYTFSVDNIGTRTTTRNGQVNKFPDWQTLLFGVLIAGVIIGVFVALNRSGTLPDISVTQSSSLPAFFVFGLIAGLSSCAALVGGIVLSMSKQWNDMYSANTPFGKKAQPHIMFNLGRLISYAFLGTVLGATGGFFKISVSITAILTIAVALLMFALALQMLGVKALRNFQIGLPKLITRKIADEQNFKGKFMPFTMGILTFFLPCGFTITAQALALSSGSLIQGGLIMLFFALGTTPTLLFIGLSSASFPRSNRNRFWGETFGKMAGVLVLFFAIFTISTQLNLLGVDTVSFFDPLTSASSRIGRSIGSTGSGDGSGASVSLAPVESGVQIMRTTAYSGGYTPDSYKIKVGVPVRWEITNGGVSGCTSTLIAPAFFDDRVRINQNLVTVEFTPEKSGNFIFSCSMGMVVGSVEVVD